MNSSDNVHNGSVIQNALWKALNTRIVSWCVLYFPSIGAAERHGGDNKAGPILVSVRNTLTAIASRIVPR